MAKTIYPLDYILKLLLDGKVQEGTQALSDYVEDQKQKRGKAGRAGSRERKSEAAKRRWEARHQYPLETPATFDPGKCEPDAHKKVMAFNSARDAHLPQPDMNEFREHVARQGRPDLIEAVLEQQQERHRRMDVEAAGGLDTIRVAEEVRQACNKHTPEQRAAGLKRAMEIINGAANHDPLPTECDERPHLGGWAPGNYFNKCACGTMFIGDKRAWVCAPCAYGDKKPEPKLPPGVGGAGSKGFMGFPIGEDATGKIKMVDTSKLNLPPGVIKGSEMEGRG